jgi:uncharacterized protein (DUF2147 family)
MHNATLKHHAAEELRRSHGRRISATIGEHSCTLMKMSGVRQIIGFAGDTGDSAAMNIWLHAQVMKKPAENGGKVPADC